MFGILCSDDKLGLCCNEDLGDGDYGACHHSMCMALHDKTLSATNMDLATEELVAGGVSMWDLSRVCIRGRQSLSVHVGQGPFVDETSLKDVGLVIA
jgi:hypothetical protein